MITSSIITYNKCTWSEGNLTKATTVVNFDDVIQVFLALQIWHGVDSTRFLDLNNNNNNNNYLAYKALKMSSMLLLLVKGLKGVLECITTEIE